MQSRGSTNSSWLTTCPADLPDWLLALSWDDCREEPCDELIEAASLRDVHREWPGICFDTARALITGNGAAAARLEAPSGGIRSFWHSCGFERRERFGRAE